MAVGRLANQQSGCEGRTPHNALSDAEVDAGLGPPELIAEQNRTGQAGRTDHVGIAGNGTARRARRPLTASTSPSAETVNSHGPKVVVGRSSNRWSASQLRSRDSSTRPVSMDNVLVCFRRSLHASTCPRTRRCRGQRGPSADVQIVDAANDATNDRNAGRRDPRRQEAEHIGVEAEAPHACDRRRSKARGAEQDHQATRRDHDRMRELVELTDRGCPYVTFHADPCTSPALQCPGTSVSAGAVFPLDPSHGIHRIRVEPGRHGHARHLDSALARPSTPQRRPGLVASGHARPRNRRRDGAAPARRASAQVCPS